MFLLSFLTLTVHENGYETRQSSLLYVFALVFDLNRARKHNSCLLRTEELINRNVLVK